MAIIRLFFFPLRFRYINCDVEIFHPIIILVCLCICGYYITLIYIYIYSLSVGRGVVSSRGCQLDVNLLFFRGLLLRGCQWLAQRERSHLWGNINCEQSTRILGTRCHVCVRGGYMKMVLTCVEASLFVSICCGPDSQLSCVFDYPPTYLVRLHNGVDTP